MADLDDHEHAGPENTERTPTSRDPAEQARATAVQHLFSDSIAPVRDSGQLQAWDGEHRVDPTLRLELAPGHTPGSSVAWLDTGPGAVFVGDLLHTPVQPDRPDDSCDVDIDADAARTSRREVLSEAARAGAQSGCAAGRQTTQPSRRRQ